MSLLTTTNVDYVKNIKGTNYWRNRILKVAKDNTGYNFAVSNKYDFQHELSEFGLDFVAGDKPAVTARTTIQSKKKLFDYLTIVFEKKRLKEESQKRKSVGVLPPVSSSARKPLRPTNMNTTVTVRPAPTPAKPGLNTTVTVTKVTLKSASKPRKPSLELASCPPWSQDTMRTR